MVTENVTNNPIDGQMDDFDRDSLWSLPLIMIPLQSKGLQNTRLIKNNELEGVVELFSDEKTGRGYVIPDHLPKFFSGVTDSDINVVRKLSVLNSYDVYSLRITLRQNDINIDDYENLQLSDGKQSQLQDYMKPFISDLIMNIFNPDDADAIDIQDDNWLNVLYNPDVEKTLNHLRALAKNMNIKLSDVPKVMQNYGDVYLSVAYYRQCLDEITPVLHDFIKSTAEIAQHQQIKNDFITLGACKKIYQRIKKMQTSIDFQLQEFDKSSKEMWVDLTPKKFQKFKSIVENNHLLIGSGLCALSVKMKHWSEKFPNPDLGSPMQRADFIMNDMAQGLEKYLSTMNK